MTATLYGIRNCDTVRKARRWLDEHQVAYHFHDFRGDGLPDDLVEGWLEACGWERLVNRRSSTWKSLDADRRASMNDASALGAIREAPTLIKRPVLAAGDALEIGFSELRYAAIFGLADAADTTREEGEER